MEMQQTARIVASQIADEIRMAGQGLPLYATAFDTVASEAVAVILNSSTDSRIDFRAGLSNIETSTNTFGSNDFTLGVSRSLSVPSTAGFSAGKFVYLAGPSANSSWAWLRAEIIAVAPMMLTLIPRNTGTTDTTIHFTASPTISLEEAVSIYLSGGSIRRATASSTTNPAAPTWSAANEIGRNFTALRFTYYDARGNIVEPSSLTNRTAIARVKVQVTVETAAPLSNGSRPSYSLQFTTVPRNMQRE
jgi:hypothetical protein